MFTPRPVNSSLFQLFVSGNAFHLPLLVKNQPKKSSGDQVISQVLVKIMMNIKYYRKREKNGKYCTIRMLHEIKVSKFFFVQTREIHFA